MLRGAKRLIYYLFINILVSACTILAILLLWERVRGPLLPNFPESTSAPLHLPTFTPQPQPQTTPLPSPDFSQPQLEIVRVVGAGDLPTEYLILRRVGTGALSLENWRIRSPNGAEYTFPQLILYDKGSVVNLHTTTGSNQVSDLYWGLSQSAWAPGSLVTLFAPDGSIHTTYVVP
ncbi:MAG: hypothetical protein OHK0052_16100 [Anaerolineales bacterium]